MSAGIRHRLSSLHPALALEVVSIVAIWAGLLWCVAETEERAMQRAEVRP
jgi:hypothetical protein